MPTWARKRCYFTMSSQNLNNFRLPNLPNATVNFLYNLLQNGKRFSQKISLSLLIQSLCNTSFSLKSLPPQNKTLMYILSLYSPTSESPYQQLRPNISIKILLTVSSMFSVVFLGRTFFNESTYFFWDRQVRQSQDLFNWIC